jgi:hypothetical protein
VTGKKSYTDYDLKYQARPEQVKNRVARNAARRDALKQGLVHKGDGKDIAHKQALDNGGSNAKSNVSVQSAAENRGWRKGRKGYSVPNK